MVERLHDSVEDVCHEIKAPLSIIRGEAEVALRVNGDSAVQYRDALQNIAEGAVQASQLVEDFMFLARSEMGDVPYEMESVDVRSMLEQAVRRSSALAQLSGIEVEFIQSSDLQGAVAVKGDLRRLRQLFVILMDNALKYTQPGGKLEISAAVSSDTVITHFTDTGIGISSEDLALVFSRFYRASDERVRARQGTGLGLPIAKSIAQMHDGRIAIASELGKGNDRVGCSTAFYIKA